MKERPILFSGPMVRAILEGRKTQTRRVMKPQPIWHKEGYMNNSSCYQIVHSDVNGYYHLGGGRGFAQQEFARSRCPYGTAADHLWVRETWARPGEIDYIYEADPEADPEADQLLKKWKADPNYPQVKWSRSIHMPRKASRIYLEIVSVKVERLKDISEDDAKAEGAKTFPKGGIVFEGTAYDKAKLCHTSAVTAFSRCWDEIYGEGSWDSNPWVWRIEFGRVA